MKEMHESELEQVRAHCEQRLHDEVEQAKHDIARALEEQIQVLPVTSFSVFLWCWVFCDCRYGQPLNFSSASLQRPHIFAQKCYKCLKLQV